MKCYFCGLDHHRIITHAEHKDKLPRELTPSEKEQAAKALREAMWRRFPMAWLDDIDDLQEELAKVGLAIQPINKPDKDGLCYVDCIINKNTKE